VAPLHQRLGQLGRVDAGQHGVQRRITARLLAGGDDDRDMPRLGVRQVAHRVAGARRRVQVHQRRPAGGLREAVRHPDRGALLQREDVAEVAAAMSSNSLSSGARSWSSY
jgi:hypothetical protein